MLEPSLAAPLTGAERLTPDGASVADFWRWAFSDLRSNVVRGVLAEFLVGRALGAELVAPRAAWDNYDFKTATGWKVEVKASAYLQSWKQRKLSTITFSRLRGRLWDDDTARYVGEPTVRADVFVFAVHTCVEPSVYDMLDRDQWDFYAVAGTTVAGWNADRCQLAHVQRAAHPVKWEDLESAVADVMSAGRAR